MDAATARRVAEPIAFARTLVAIRESAEKGQFCAEVKLNDALQKKFKEMGYRTYFNTSVCWGEPGKEEK